MSLKSRLGLLENQLPKEEIPEDPDFPYVVTAEHFDHVCRELHCIFNPAPDVDEMLKQFTADQARDVWLRHYGYWENGILTEPPPEWIEEYDRFGNMSLQDWYQSVFRDVLRFPHSIQFDLADYGLIDWEEEISSMNHIEYNLAHNQ